ncbi:DUF3137 domain-containing protein [Alteraurantiacibacter buctensis]|uniref:DUF3137 domain-containing protein n=1 Tax=Alteraurantiacibacter buctensis TaxID=1503981 RepID=A0A844YZT2_9SPHN|nr:DUF3137 domain-containing protein [Alteraurantiacibacter buctensis]MXO72440.1 DUF3137 domain-containing protein [Alteraurantiacibacter buctensis]
MIERPDVDALMAGELGEWLQHQATVREDARHKSNGRFVKAAVIFFPLAIGLAMLGWNVQVTMFILFFAAVGLGIWAYNPRGQAIKETKEGINSALARALGLSFSSATGETPGFLRATTFRMLPGYSRKSFEDLWSGEIGGRAFALHEAHLEQKRQSGKNSHYVTVFRGPIMTIAAGRRFTGVTLVERSGRHKRFGFFGEKEDLEVGGVRLDRVDMVHPQFEDEFTVYSSDQVEARYLVHPTYVEKLIALESAFAGQKIRTLFAEGELTVVLEAANMFESGNMDAARDRELVETCVSQFMSMAELAGSLNEARG